MCADRVYDEDFFAAAADRGFYVFTSPCQAAAARGPRSVPVILTHVGVRPGSDHAGAAPTCLSVGQFLVSG